MRAGIRVVTGGLWASDAVAIDHLRSGALPERLSVSVVYASGSGKRLSAGRRSLSREAAALCFLAGANSIFIGEKLLTTPNPERDEDEQLLRDLGLRASGNGPVVAS